ncbi:MAG: hypothetical protein K0Q99_2065 [Clostridia bacterium]|jgi:predicted phage-related endonuclease|nr:hypothetical protein [Clostridia bacterium]
MNHCQQHLEHNYRFEALENNIKDMQHNENTLLQNQFDIKERITKVEAASKSAHHRLDNMEEQTKAIIKMSISIEYMAKQVEEMLMLYKEHDGRLDKLEQAPGAAIIGYWKLFIGALVTGSAGVLIGLLLKGGY